MWKSRISSTATFDEFAEVCTSYATAVREEGQRLSAAQFHRPGQPQRGPPARPNNRPPRPNCPHVTYNPIEARRIQTLYHLSKKRAARQILSDSTISYTGSSATAKTYFDDVYQPKDVNTDNLFESLLDHVPTAPTDHTLMDPLTVTQVNG